MDLPVPKRLKEARLAAKISQKKLGIAAGMDEFSASARMNHYEIGRHAPDYSTLERIGKALNLPVAYFYASSDELAKLIQGFQQLNEIDQIYILQTIEGLLHNSS